MGIEISGASEVQSTGVGTRAIDDFAAAASSLGPLGAVLTTRFARRWPAAEQALRSVYGDALDPEIERIVACLVDAAAARPAALQLLDAQREAEPMWFQHERMIGYVAYTDRFAGRLDAVAARIPYLRELGVTYLHLMPVLQPREGDSDGGYAVVDYDQVDPRLGTMGDLEALAAALREAGISLCVDVVMNHTAREHEWAVSARAGDADKRAYFHVFADRQVPDQYDATLREVFPDFAPGNFTSLGGTAPDDTGDEVVWTTFNEFQWDLNYANPQVMLEMLGVMLRLANRGIEVLRLDAAPFIWKRLGTDCENQPEVHHLLTAYRALTAVVAPALLLQAEAIVPRDELKQYLGAELAAGEPQRIECNLAYHNQLMVQLWSSLAAGEGRLMGNVLADMGQIPHDASWCTYVRCHDDIGWAITGTDAMSVGWDEFAHRDFLNAFYSGEFAMSYARGARFQHNPVTGDARISGTTASLCGIDDALRRGDDLALDAAVNRLALLYAVTYAFGGVPLLYMGDELALRNDEHYADDPRHADDNRWMHRPHMDWAAADRRSVGGSLEQRVFTIFTRMASARASLPEVRGGGTVDVLRQGDDRLFAFARRHRRENPIWMAANFGNRTMVLEPRALHTHNLVPGRSVLTGAGADMVDGQIVLPPLGWVWLVR